MDYPTLYHYTSEDGLRGIVGEQVIWATHYQFLNDTNEVFEMRDPLVAHILPTLEKAILDQIRSSLKAKRIAKKQGGVKNIAREIAARIVDPFYKVTFGDDERQPIAEPYITSFCSHQDDEYAAENGLLSQWRSYAEGGYALVFDTEELCRLLTDHEDTLYRYYPGTFGRVIYNGDVEGFQEEFKVLLNLLVERVSEFLNGDYEVGDMFGPFIRSVSSFKHCGFREEKEVRMVSTPWTPDLQKIPGEIDDASNGKAAKTVKYRGENADIPYIEMFDFDCDLPIKKIIVGPHRNQQIHYSSAKEVVGKLGIEVTKSDTPYVGQG